MFSFDKLYFSNFKPKVIGIGCIWVNSALLKFYLSLISFPFQFAFFSLYCSCIFNLKKFHFYLYTNAHLCFLRKLNRTLEARDMLERCLKLDTAYSPAYLVLAKLHTPPIAARLLRHVTRLLSNSPDYQAYFADWLYDRGEFWEQLLQVYYIEAFF